LECPKFAEIWSSPWQKHSDTSSLSLFSTLEESRVGLLSETRRNNPVSQVTEKRDASLPLSMTAATFDDGIPLQQEELPSIVRLPSAKYF
jgi:hypothetical protein